MKYHENLSLSDSAAEKIQAMPKKEALNKIKAFNLFGGYPTKIADAENLKIYDKINARKFKKEVGSPKPTTDTKGNGTNNKK